MNEDNKNQEKVTVRKPKKPSIFKVVKTGIKEAKDSIAEAVEYTADSFNETAEKVKIKVEQVKDEIEKNILKPVFADEYFYDRFDIPDLIRIISSDSKHENSKLCEGSIGFIDVIDGYKVLNIYKKDIDTFLSKEINGKPLELNPEVDFDFFHVHPCNKSTFININDYFEDIKQDKIAELQKIAYDLGAKHVTINYLEEQKSLTGNKAKVRARGKIPHGKADAEYSADNTLNSQYKYSEDIVEHYEGSDNPKTPNLVYFKNTKSIKNLIEERISGDHDVHQIDKTIKCSTSLGIKRSEAAKIDAAFKFYKINGNASVSSEVEQENRMVFKYHIEF